MNIIIVGRRHGESRSVSLRPSAIYFLLGMAVTMPLMLGAAGFLLSQHLASDLALDSRTAKAWERNLEEQRREIEELRAQADRELAALTVRLAELQSRGLRLDAVGERLVASADLEADEFDFSVPPAVGGPMNYLDSAYEAPGITAAMDELADRINSREQQLAVLDDLIAANKLDQDTFVAGSPIVKGWMSSRYGYRADPFTGRSAWHAGVDFAGKQGSDVVSVASGVVTIAEPRYGYGRLVEVNHGNGYKTRYAHCQEIKVKVGDVVRKGDVIALMGNSGRSTGPHVHFEVYRNGRNVDPAAYIHRRPR